MFVYEHELFFQERHNFPVGEVGQKHIIYLKNPQKTLFKSQNTNYFGWMKFN